MFSFHNIKLFKSPNSVRLLGVAQPRRNPSGGLKLASSKLATSSINLMFILVRVSTSMTRSYS